MLPCTLQYINKALQNGCPVTKAYHRCALILFANIDSNSCSIVWKLSWIANFIYSSTVTFSQISCWSSCLFSAARSTAICTCFKTSTWMSNFRPAQIYIKPLHNYAIRSSRPIQTQLQEHDRRLSREHDQAIRRSYVRLLITCVCPQLKPGKHGTLEWNGWGNKVLKQTVNKSQFWYLISEKKKRPADRSVLFTIRISVTIWWHFQHVAFPVKRNGGNWSKQ